MKNKKIITFSIILLILLIVGLFFISPILFVNILGESKTNLIANRIPINKSYLTAISIGIGYISYISYKHLFSFNSKKRKIGLLLFVLGSFFFFFAVGYFSNDYNYDKDGNSTKCWASDLNGSYEPVPCDWKFHPKYGTPVVSYSREIALIVNHKKDTKINRVISINENSKLFSQDGKPLIWYYLRRDGKYELFKNSGYHPQNGKSLKPITSEVAEIIFSYIDKNKIENILYKSKKKVNKEKEEQKRKDEQERIKQRKERKEIQKNKKREEGLLKKQNEKNEKKIPNNNKLTDEIIFDKSKNNSVTNWNYKPFTIGEKSKNVHNIHKFLNLNKKTQISKSGLNSPKNEGSYATDKTIDAVKRFQKLCNINITGNINEETNSLMKRLYNGETISVNQTNVTSRKNINNSTNKKACEENNTGNYTIINNTNKTFRLNVVAANQNDNLNHSNRYAAKIILRPNQKKQFYDVSVKKYFYYVFDKNINSSFSYDEGYFKVKNCETKIITIASNYSSEKDNTKVVNEIDCNAKNTGNICIINGTTKTFRLNVEIAKSHDNLNHSSLSFAKITLRPNQKKCFYDLPAKKHFYYVFDSSIHSAYANSYDEGYIKVVKCKTNSYTIE